MAPTTATELFVNDVQRSIVDEIQIEEGDPIQNEYDNSDYFLAGNITDHRDGKISVKMGKLTDKEALDIIIGGNA